MTQEEILDYNKRCAEFLGFKYRNSKKAWAKYPLDNNSFLALKGWLSMDRLQFHSDWNWTHELVEAIERLKYLVAIQSNFCQIQEIGTKENKFEPLSIASLYSNSKKVAVVQAINQFLIWYNNEYKN